MGLWMGDCGCAKDLLEADHRKTAARWGLLHLENPSNHPPRHFTVPPTKGIVHVASFQDINLSLVPGHFARLQNQCKFGDSRDATNIEQHQQEQHQREQHQQEQRQHEQHQHDELTSART